jgi:hypothetical protein
VKLSDILYKVSIRSIIGSTDIEVKDVLTKGMTVYVELG